MLEGKLAVKFASLIVITGLTFHVKANMDPIIGGALIGAGANLLGGLFGRKSQESAADRNIKLQREFAKNGIRWRVEDAKKAGLHPLFALGAQTQSFNPISVADPLPDALANMGQDIGRAVTATQTAAERAPFNALALERAQLENELLKSQIAKNTAQLGPAMPSLGAQAFPIAPDGIITRDLVEVKPSEVISARSNEPQTEAGPAGPAWKELDAGAFGKWKVPGAALSQGFEDLEMLKYMAIIAENFPGSARKWREFNSFMQQSNKPDWVRRMEKEQGVKMWSPRKGYWQFVDLSSPY